MGRQLAVACSLVSLVLGQPVIKQPISVPGWPAMSGVPLSTGMLSHGMILPSGMSGINMTTFKLVPGGVQAETNQSLTLISEILQASGKDMSHVAACAVYLQDIKDFAAMNEVYASWFTKPRPARVAMQVEALAGGASVEIKCTGSDAPVAQVVVPDWPDMTDKFPFSTGIVAGGFVFASGVVGVDFTTGKMVEGGIVAETKQALENVRQTVEAGGSSMAEVVNCMVYLPDLKDYEGMNEAYTLAFPKPQPSRTTMQVAALAGAAAVEIQCVAALPSSGRKTVVVPSWPLPVPFSLGTVSGGLLFASGAPGIDVETQKVVPGGIAAETNQSLTLIKQIIEAGGSSMANIVDCAVYLTDMKDFMAMNAVYAKFFPAPPPARVCTSMGAGSLVYGAAVQIQCTAAMPAAMQANKEDLETIVV